MTDLTQATAAELSSLYQAGAASPVTVAEQVLAKIARVNPILNAFCFTDPNTTLVQARASAQRWQQGQPLSNLDGVPVAVKDSILTRGWPTRYASRAIDPDQSWTEDAPAVARLREAGAIFVGKTTMSEFGSTEYHSNSLLYGNGYNPWNGQCTSGGSSGGSAAAVGAGLVPVAIGSDIGGSISVPASFCGIIGLKPSFGKIAHYPSGIFNLATVGVFARQANDLALVMNLITGPDVRDSTSLPATTIDYVTTLNRTISGLRVAYCKTIVSQSADVDTLSAVDQTANWLASQGATIDLVELDVFELMDICYDLIRLEFYQHWMKIPLDRQHLTHPNIQKRALIAHLKIDVCRALEKRQQLMIKMRKFMQSYDVILSPATTTTADKILVDDLPSSPSSPFSLLYSTVQQPTITVPVGVNSNSMPVAVMIAGAMHDDVRVLQVAHAIEKQFPMPACPVIL
jgi:aspartyl-tRNA(Asn)/glutamyl-tRNA(Gln) amidotransferase subunit A